MPVLVVEDFEVVEVEHGHAEGGAGPPPPVHGEHQRLVPAATIGDPGEPVGQGLVANPAHRVPQPQADGEQRADHH